MDWLLTGDVAIVFQAKRDLLGASPAEIASWQARIATEGWGQQLLAARRPDGHWGRGFYLPKWTSTHYTLLELKGLGLSPTNPEAAESIRMILADAMNPRGGVNYARTVKDSDVCINGMVLDVACYFRLEPALLEPLVDYLLTTVLPGGGWNCQHLRGDRHFSVHTTLSVLEGLASYLDSGFSRRRGEVRQRQAEAEELLLSHRLYRSHRTGEPMDTRMLSLSYPPRWRYDILRALDYFRATNRAYDPRLADALAVIARKRRPDGTWALGARHPGQVHVEMERSGQPSRWITLRALRVLAHFNRQPESRVGVAPLT